MAHKKYIKNIISTLSWIINFTRNNQADIVT